MRYNEFIDEVQNRALFISRDEAIEATQATLQTFGERLAVPVAIELVGYLPEEIGNFLLLNLEMPAERPSATNFFKRVAAREGVDIGLAVYHARAVIEVLQKVLWDARTANLCDSVVADITPLFENAVLGDTWRESVGMRPVHRSFV